MLTKAIADIQYSDIIEFISRNERENWVLDYKESISGGFAKTACAFANTYGGTIIFGVADKDGYPDPTSKGIPFQERLSEQVTRTIVDNVMPPLIPQVQVCQKDGLAFVVARIPEAVSDRPYVVGGKKVYVRTGDINTPDDMADLDRIAWLESGRARAREFRKRILGAMKDRCDNVQTSNMGEGVPFGLLSISIGPLYPHSPLMTDKQVFDLPSQIRVNSFGWAFPPTSGHLRSVQSGIQMSEFHQRRTDFNCLEVNKFGYLYFRQTIGEQKMESAIGGQERVASRYIEVHRIVAFADILLHSWLKMIAATPFRGTARLTIQLDSILGVRIQPYYNRGYFDYADTPVSVDNQLIWMSELTGPEVEDRTVRFDKIFRLAEEICFSLGFPNETTYIERQLKKESGSRPSVARNQ